MLAEIAFRLSGTSWGSYPIRGHLVTSAGVLVQPATPMSRSTRMFDIFADRGLYPTIGKLNDNLNLSRDTYEGSRVPRRLHRRV